MNTFTLILTLCGVMNDGRSSCEAYILERKQKQVECLESIVKVYNHEKTDLYNLMGDTGEGWIKVDSENLHCVAENKE